MKRERLIKDYDNLGMRCKWAVQYFDDLRQLWRYKETYNAKGFNPYMPKWYDTEEEARKHFERHSKIEETVVLGFVNDIYRELDK